MGPDECAAWVKSSYCDDSKECVEVCFGDGAARVRNGGGDHQGPVLVFTRTEWEVFLLGAFNGEFEMPL
jgi:hypothetical protein